LFADAEYLHKRSSGRQPESMVTHAILVRRNEQLN
jgi:hypothetical protein